MKLFLESDDRSRAIVVFQKIFKHLSKKFLKFLSDFTTIQDFGLNRKILRARFCGSVHSYALSCHFDCRIIASRCGHFYLSFHHFCRESRSCFHSTNFHSCSMGRRYSTSGKYLHIN